MTRLRIGDPGAAKSLVDALCERADCVCTVIDENTIEVSLLGSLGVDAHRLELELRLRAWQAGHPETTLEIVEARPA